MSKITQILGPRQVMTLDSNNAEVAIDITITFENERRFDLGDGVFLDQTTGRARVESEMFSFEETVLGDDQIQVIFRLAWLVGVSLIKRCDDRGLTLFKHEPGDVKEWQDLFS